jgi:hypothetical protein
MQAALQPALEDVEKALAGLETALEKRLVKERKATAVAAQAQAQVLAAPRLDLPRNESEVSRKLAARLDQTISRLETILSEDA